MDRFKYSQTGFTVMETLLAAFILVFVVGCAAIVYLMSVTTWKEASAQISLQREASAAMEKMVRGVDGTDGIREAGNVIIGSGIITYTSGIDSGQRKFYLSDGKIMYDPDTTTPDDEFSIAQNVRASGLTFSNGNIITIDLGMSKQVIDKNIDVDLTTKVNLRN